MRLEVMKERKRELGYSAKQIAELSGVPLSTVQKIFGGYTKHPRHETLRALEAVLRWETPEHAADRMILREEAFDYQTGKLPDLPLPGKRQGEYTIEDYYALPDDQRVELIDGVIYYMTAPSTVHQVVTGSLSTTLMNFVMENRGQCVVQAAPSDVRLDLDDRTMLQPDVLVTCDRKKITYLRIEGAPDMVIEVLSPSTRKKDLYIKVNKYAGAGVRELWLVDPRDRRIFVYDLEHDDTISTYTFRDSVPVLIFGGQLSVDFAALDDYLTDLFGDAWWEK